MKQEIKEGYCHCGCGEKTNIVKKNNIKRKYIKGKPHKYIKGHQMRLSPLEYKINKKIGCWEWQRSKRSGYGAYSKEGKNYGAHRYYYEKYNGKIPKGMCVCHLCDNKSCVNPKHLFLGTNKDNTQDMIKKGRNYIKSGEKNPQSKLSWKEVYEIRKKYKKGDKIFSSVALAKKYNVRQGTISFVINNKTWIK